MSSERIIIDVDDVELDIAIAKLKQASVMQGSMIAGMGATGPGNFGAFWRQINRDLGETTREMGNLEKMTGVKFSDIPTINRELRFLMNQAPGMREVTSLWFQVRRGLRGVDIGGTQLLLTMTVISIAILKAAHAYQLKVERDRRAYERFIRRERGITHEEYGNLVTEWQAVFRGRPG